MDSAWRAVYEYLLASGQDEKIPTFFHLWGTNIEWVQPSSKFDDDEGDGEVPPDTEAGGGGGGGLGGINLNNTLLRAHMGYTYAAELSGNVKF